MRPENLRLHLRAQAPAADTLAYLNQTFIPAVIGRLNDVNTRRRMALYGGDRIPENERNLTDVRNRMSLLFEYKLAWIGNDILRDLEVEEIFWTNVVANRFPDLELRDLQGGRGIRVEVKCLQSIAEEKSANFETLKKDLNPNTDYIVVFVWEWFRDEAAVDWDRAPKILRGFVFHASSLAELRDYNWLNTPPNDLGNGHQGFDLRYAVNCRQGVYNEEEGNYGKLLRIWDDSVQYAGPATPLIPPTIALYKEFEDFSVWSGFEVLAPYLLSSLNLGAVAPLIAGARGLVGFRAGELGILFKRRAKTAADQLAAARAARLNRLIVMNDKYQWTDNRVGRIRLERNGEGRKPKHLALHLSEN